VIWTMASNISFVDRETLTSLLCRCMVPPASCDQPRTAQFQHIARRDSSLSARLFSALARGMSALRDPGAQPDMPKAQPLGVVSATVEETRFASSKKGGALIIGLEGELLRR